MPAQWLEQTGHYAERASAAVQQSLSGPETPRRLRRALLAVLALWAVFALARLIWALWPVPQPAPLPADIINPATRSDHPADARAVDIETLVARRLFGEAGAGSEVAALVEVEASTPVSDREGIEDGARETRLDLALRGVVASTDTGLGHAIIEHRNLQAVYAVDDELPVGARVKLAKVMPGQVVIDNNGTYELLTLFEETALDRQLSGQAARGRSVARPASSTLHVDKRTDPAAAELASRYRQQLYDNPESLASLVRISAVREDGVLRGYRVVPGRDARQFKQLGFRAGDLVLAVNGISLDEPANTMRLYQTMRSATEATFELLRDEQPVTVSVDLGVASDVQ